MPVTYYIYLIPLTNSAQTFVINLAGTNYTLTVKWNAMANGGIGSWYLDIADANQNPLAFGIPFVTGTSLLSQLEYIGIDGDLYVYTNGQATTVPTYDDLGVNSNLYFESTVANNGS